jgi:hypothetical protein
MKKYFNLILSTLALVAIAILIAAHFEYTGLQSILFAAIALGFGYWFGTWTCHLHKKQTGFWVTIAIFIVLNLMHSMIDGASIGGITSFTTGIAVLSHEFARQPALYVVLWGMLTPFALGKQYRFLIVPVIVTGIWFLGVYLGIGLFQHVNDADWLEPIAQQALFLFLGDIIHHIYEEHRKLRNRHTCCHTHA